MTLLSILKIQTKIFINNFAKINSVLKIIYLLAGVFILFNYSQAGILFIELIKTHLHFYEVLNLLFFVIFLLNLFSVFFLGTGNTLSKQLKFFPISFIKIVLYEILIGLFDISNLVFVGIYFSTYFVFYETFSMLSFLKFSFIFILLISIISNISFFLKNIISSYFSLLRKKKVIQIISLILLALLFQFLLSLNINKLNLMELSKILNYTPTGGFLLFQFNVKLSSFFFLKISAYFLFLNFMFLVINILLTKKLFKTYYSNVKSFNKLKRKISLFDFVKKSQFNPLQKKEILYNFRSIRIIFSFLLLFLGYLVLLCDVIFQSNSGDEKELSFILQNIGILFQSILIVTLTGNIFRFDDLNIKAYFLFPISSSLMINSKVVVTYFSLLLNLIFVTIGLFYLGITIFNYLLFIALLLILFYLFHFLAIVLSIYFPKKVDMNALNGLNISFITLLISVPFLLIGFLLGQYILNFTELFPKIIVIFFAAILSVILYKLQITNHLATQLIKRKSSIIEEIS